MKAIENYDSIRTMKKRGGNRNDLLLEPGAYRVLILAVDAQTEKFTHPYIEITYNVWDPELQRFYYTDSDITACPWNHTKRIFTQYGFGDYKRLVNAVEQTEENEGFQYVNADGAEQSLVGKWCGAIIHTREYVSTKHVETGEVKRIDDVAAFLPLSDALNGRFDHRLLDVDSRQVKKFAEQHPSWQQMPWQTADQSAAPKPTATPPKTLPLDTYKY